MSYLGCPRIDWMGLFYTNPGNLNNLLTNYSSAELDYKTGLYKYPDGVAQWWLEGCVVTSVVGSDGMSCADPAKDSLVGATVETPGPTTQKPDPQGSQYAIGKIADLDPHMQFRSELYGIRLNLAIPGGGGFSGWWPMPPQLRDLYFSRRNAGIDGLQVAVGTWHQRLTDLVWTDPGQPSSVYETLKAHGQNGLDVKIAVDMFQTNRSDEFSKGNRFGYGRLVASIGSRGKDDPDQLVPGRRLYSGELWKEDSQTPQLASTTDFGPFTRQAAEEQAATLASPDPVWNRTDARVVECGGRSQLLLDVGGSFPLKEGGKGELDILDGTVVGFLETDQGNEVFTPIANGEVKVSYTQLADGVLKLKDCVWPEHAGILSIELAGNEPERIKGTRLAMREGESGPLLLKENPDGIYVNVDTASIRMEPESEQVVGLYGFEFGQPVPVLPQSLNLKTAFDTDSLSDKPDPNDLFSVSIGEAGPGGCFPLKITTKASIPLVGGTRCVIDDC